MPYRLALPWALAMAWVVGTGQAIAATNKHVYTALRGAQSMIGGRQIDRDDNKWNDINYIQDIDPASANTDTWFFRFVVAGRPDSQGRFDIYRQVSGISHADGRVELVHLTRNIPDRVFDQALAQKHTKKEMDALRGLRGVTTATSREGEQLKIYSSFDASGAGQGKMQSVLVDYYRQLARFHFRLEDAINHFVHKNAKVMDKQTFTTLSRDAFADFGPSFLKDDPDMEDAQAPFGHWEYTDSNDIEVEMLNHGTHFELVTFHFSEEEHSSQAQKDAVIAAVTKKAQTLKPTGAVGVAVGFDDRFYNQVRVAYRYDLGEGTKGKTIDRWMTENFKSRKKRAAAYEKAISKAEKPFN